MPLGPSSGGSAALALVWVIIAQHQEPKPGLYLMPGIFATPTTTKYATRKACEKIAAEYQKAAPVDTLLECVEERKSN